MQRSYDVYAFRFGDPRTGRSREAEALGWPIAAVFHIINATTREPAIIPVNKVLAIDQIHPAKRA